MRKAIKLLIFVFIIIFFPNQIGHQTNTRVTLHKNAIQLIETPQQIIAKTSIKDFKNRYEGEKCALHVKFFIGKAKNSLCGLNFNIGDKINSEKETIKHDVQAQLWATSGC